LKKRQQGCYLAGALFVLLAASSVATGADSLVWTPPPAPAAIRYVRNVAAPANWGITSSFFGRMIDALSGKPDDRFVRPTGVAERDGVLYVADPGAPALWIIDAQQNLVRKVSQVADATLLSPVAVALGPDGSVFVADSMLKKVFALDRNGNLLRVAAQGLERPVALAFDAAGRNLLVADSVSHRIAVFGPTGMLVRTFGERGSGDGQFNGPAYLALDRGGTLLVTDALNFRVQAFDRDGRFLWKMGHAGDGSGDFAAPKGVAADSEGHVYVVDALFESVQIFDTEGRLLMAFGEHGTRVGQFWLPSGIFIGPQNEIYVADAYNRRIQVFQSEQASGSGGAK